MTCIVACKDKCGVVWLGADSAGTANDWTMAQNYAPKIYASGRYLFGFTTSYRMGQIIGLRFCPPEPINDDLGRFMATAFIDALRACLKDSGWSKKENERESGGTFIAVLNGRIFQVQDDYSVHESPRRYDAVGSGAAVAFGAFAALEQTKVLDSVPAPELLRIVLTAAQSFNAAVREPFFVYDQTGVAHDVKARRATEVSA